MNSYRSRGFSLIEILVTMVLVSVGLLGVASMQALNMKNNANSTLRTQASVLAYDAIDRLRANRTRALNDEYDVANIAAVNLGGLANGIVKTDLTDWQTALIGFLPGGTGTISVAAGILTVTVQWTERDNFSAGGSRNLSYTLTTQL